MRSTIRLVLLVTMGITLTALLPASAIHAAGRSGPAARTP